MNRKAIIILLFLASVIIFISNSPVLSSNGSDELSLTFYGNWGCIYSNEKSDLIENYVTEHPEINATYLWIPNDILIEDYYNQMDALGEDSPAPPPTVVLNKSGVITVLYSDEITTTNLEFWRTGQMPHKTEFTIWIAFTTGLVTGASACMLLLLSVLGTSLTMVESRSKYLLISIGLIAGFIAAYLAVTAVFLATIYAFSVITYLKYIFGGVLLAIGVWQIIDFKRENSVIFGTPNRVKSILKSLMEKNSGIYAFILGSLFAFIKIPCFGAPYLQLLFVSQNDPLIALLVGFYLLGTVIPIAIVLVVLRLGFQSERVSEIRLKYRSYLRLLSGVFIITLTLYLFLDIYLSIEIILWIILAELGTFILAIWLKSRGTQKSEVLSP